MTGVLEQTLLDVEEEGRRAALAGAPISACPYTDRSLLMTQRWRKGYERGEVEEAEGQHFRTG